MKFEGYKFSFKINASRSISLENSYVSNHTFNITIFVRKKCDCFEAYDITENIINEYLDSFSGAFLNEISPFNIILPTVENIGEVLFTEIYTLLANNDFVLWKLEISETPQRFYVISEETLSEEKKENLRLARKNIESSMVEYDKEPIISTNEKEIPEDVSEMDIVEPLASVKSVAVSEDFSDYSLPSSSSKVTFVFSILFMILAGFAVMTAVKLSNIYPLGLDIHGHLFKSDLMFQELKKGNFYPLYTEYWYNGLQPFRYWPPLPYYFMSLFQFICRGDIMNAYLGFIWASFTIGGTGWVLFGRKLNRPFLGLFFGVMWFMLPDNLRVFFGEGNLPRMFITMLLPYILYCLWQFVHYRRKKMIFPLIILMILAIFGHLMISAMIGVASAIFLLIYSISNKRIKESFTAILAMLFSFAVAGIWVYPSLVGGITAMSSGGNSDLMASLSAKLSVSLNPLLRLSGGVTELYFGLSIAIIAFIGVFLSNKKSLSGFMTMLIIILGTTTALTPLIQELPLSSLFWVRRFAPIAYAMFVIAVFEWKNLKKLVLVFLCGIIILDCVPSADLYSYDEKMNIPATIDDIEQSMDENLFTQAKEITKQRVSLMDLSILGPMPSYAFGTLEKKTPYVFGWAWQGAATANNIAYLNESLEKENYLYMFDRNLELGADTVIIDKIQIKDDDDREKLISAATRVGYKIAGESDRTLLFSLNAQSTFGVISDYKGIAIGSTAALIPAILPYYFPGNKLTIDEYSAEELEQYNEIYLSGFFYNDKKTAENLVREVAEHGVKVYVDMNRIPADPLTSRMTFLDVSAQPITFYVKYPALVTEKGEVSPTNFSKGYENWNTVYLTNLKNSMGYSLFEETKVDFAGTGETENITFLGFNFLFHSYNTNDLEVKSILNSIMELDEEKLPEREIVPLEISYDTNKITIKSDFDNVNTTIAYQDTFSSNSKISSMNNFLIVNKGTTVITMKYPYFFKSILVSIIGIFIEIWIVILIFKKPKTLPNLERSTQV